MNPRQNPLKAVLILLGLVAALQTTVRADEVSLNLYANVLKTAGGQPMPTTGLVLLVASTNDAVFSGPTPGSFTAGDDIILAKRDLSAFGTPGFLLDAINNLTLSGGWGAGDPLAIYWFPTLNINSAAPTNGTPYGFYRDGVGVDESVPWVTPAGGATIQLNFKTAEDGSSANSAAAGNASLVVGGGNHAPVANPDSFARSANNTLNISIASLLANDTDADSNPLTFTGVIGNTANNVALTWDSNFVYYPLAPNIPDQFTYTISDGQGGTNSGICSISITNSSALATNITSQIAADGSMHIGFQGIPGYTYLVQAATNIAAPVYWQTLSTNIANLVNGSIQYTDLQASNYVNRYYRAIQP